MKKGLEKFIEDNREALDKNMPDPAVLDRILQQMNVVPETKERKGIIIPFRTLRWAAAALVLSTVGVTVYKMQSQPVVRVAFAPPAAKNTASHLGIDTVANQHHEQTTAITLPETTNMDAVDRDIAQRKTALLTKFSNNSMASRKLIFLTGLHDMDSPAKRITAVAQAGGFKMVGQDIIKALLNTLNNDPNTNVRLAALDGLARFYHETYIRRQLIASLKTQENPTVEIALIELLTRMKEVAVLDQLDKIVANDSTMTAVKDCAYSGIFKLRKT